MGAADDLKRKSLKKEDEKGRVPFALVHI